MSITGTGYVQRKEFKLFADVSATATPEWELQGDKVEELSLEMNPNVNTITDVTGVTSVTLDKYEVQTSVAPYRAKKDSKLFAILYDIVKYQKTLSDVERNFMCVNIFAVDSGKYEAWIQKAVIAVQSYGGGTEGLDIPYNIHWIGERTYGTFDPTTNTFTEGETPEYLVTFVVDDGAAPVAGAQIVINGKTITTNANGIAEILLPAGTYAYTVIADDFNNGTGSITISTAAVLEAVTMTST